MIWNRADISFSWRKNLSHITIYDWDFANIPEYLVFRNKFFKQGSFLAKIV